MTNGQTWLSSYIASDFQFWNSPLRSHQDWRERTLLSVAAAVSNKSQRRGSKDLRTSRNVEHAQPQPNFNKSFNPSSGLIKRDDAPKGLSQQIYNEYWRVGWLWVFFSKITILIEIAFSLFNLKFWSCEVLEFKVLEFWSSEVLKFLSFGIFEFWNFGGLEVWSFEAFVFSLSKILVVLQ